MNNERRRNRTPTAVTMPIPVQTMAEVMEEWRAAGLQRPSWRVTERS